MGARRWVSEVYQGWLLVAYQEPVLGCAVGHLFSIRSHHYLHVKVPSGLTKVVGSAAAALVSPNLWETHPIFHPSVACQLTVFCPCVHSLPCLLLFLIVCSSGVCPLPFWRFTRIHQFRRQDLAALGLRRRLLLEAELAFVLCAVCACLYVARCGCSCDYSSVLPRCVRFSNRVAWFLSI